MVKFMLRYWLPIFLQWHSGRKVHQIMSNLGPVIPDGFRRVLNNKGLP